MAVPTIQITGSVVAPDGSLLTSGIITAELSQPGSALDGAVSVRVVGKITGTITAGAVPADFDLVPNASITPAGTYYRVTIEGTTADGTHYKSVPPEKWQLAASPTSVDIGAVPRLEVAPNQSFAPVTFVAGDLGGTATSPEVRSTHLTNALPVSQGGTGSATGDISALSITPTGASTARTAAARAADVVNVKDFGAVGDGVADDAAAIRAAVAAGTHIVFPKGTYLATPIVLGGEYFPHVIKLPSGRTLDFQSGATLKVKYDPADTVGHYSAILMRNVSNIRILRPTIIGDWVERAAAAGGTGEFGYGINLRGGSNIQIESPHISQCWGDAFTISYNTFDTAVPSEPSDVLVRGLVADTNRRNGVSVLSADGVIFDGATIKNTGGASGVAPGLAVDLEPSAGRPLTPMRIEFRGLVTENNWGSGTGGGLSFNPGPAALDATTPAVDIRVLGMTSTSDRVGVHIVGDSGGGTGIVQGLKGHILLSNVRAVTPRRNGIVITGWPSGNYPQVEILNPSVLNPATDNTGSFTRYEAGVAVYQETTGAQADIGNVFISGLIAKDTRGSKLMSAGIWVENRKAAGTASVALTGPLMLDGGGAAFAYWRSSVTLEDPARALVYAPSGATLARTETGANYYRVVSNANVSGAGVVTLPSGTLAIGHTVTLENATGQQLDAACSSTTIQPGGITTGLRNAQVGGRLTLQFAGGTTWKVLEQIGTWSTIP